MIGWTFLTHRWPHLESVKTNPPPAVNIRVVDWRHKPHLGRFKGVPGHPLSEKEWNAIQDSVVEAITDLIRQAFDLIYPTYLTRPW